MRASLRTASALDLVIGLPIRTSPAFFEPGVFGILRPVLLLPEGIMHYLTPPELDAIVVHELCHVRHRDNLAAAFHMLVEALFWFHPLVWWLGARLMDERERRCDEEVLRSGGQPRVYAEGILKVCGLYLASPVACAAGVTGGNLKRRIEAIMTHQTAIRLTFAKRLALTFAAASTFAVSAIFGFVHSSKMRAQSPEIASSPAKFKTVSIRPFSSRPADFFTNQFLMYGAHRSPFGGRFQTEITLNQLIQLAYNVKDFQIVGPSWLNTDRYAFDAKTGSSVTFQQMQPMLQALLADRFKLTLHRETKQLPIYELAAENSGFKIAATNEDSCIPMDPHAPPGSFVPNDPSSRFCKDEVRLDPDGEFFSVDRIAMPRLVDLISNEVHRIVVDRTGFTDSFNLPLKFAPSEDARWSGPSITTALQQQLGMQLQSTQGPVEMILIDHLEKSSDN